MISRRHTALVLTVIILVFGGYAYAADDVASLNSPLTKLALDTSGLV